MEYIRDSAALFVIFWYSFHFLKTGWFISTPSTAWAAQRGWADGFQLAKNIFSIARCFFDFGIGIFNDCFIVVFI
ncbi:MAG: hypothetical protein R2807_05380 [Chitinophagales bacterium]